MAESKKSPLVRYLDQTEPTPCPYGEVRRVVTGGDGGVGNVHVVRVTRGGEHFHRGYDETYFVRSGHGHIELAGERRELRPGTVVVIPAGVLHSLEASGAEPLEFVIFGTPAMSFDDERAAPQKP